MLLKRIAAITPGIQPAEVKSSIIKIAPQPRSKTANGGKIIHNIALPHPILYSPSFNQRFPKYPKHRSLSIYHLFTH